MSSAWTVEPAPFRISCAEIWGGIRILDTDVCTRGLTAGIYSRASGSAAGGDLYYFSVCGADKLTRIVIADMRGHGAAASQLSGWLYGCIQERMNSLDGAGVLADLNRIVHAHGFHAITTAVVASYYTGDGCLHFSYAGHPPMLVQRGGEWRTLELAAPPEPGPANLPLGVMRDVRYDQDSVSLSPGDRVFLFTDGLLECPDPDGEFFGEERLLDALSAAGACTLHELKHAVREALHRHAAAALDHDDCTFIAAELAAR